MANEKVEQVPEVQLFGIKELKELLAFGFKLQKAITGSLEDEKVNWLDTFRFTPVLMSGPSAFEGIKMIDDEIHDLNEEEKQELRDYAAEFYPEFENSELQILVEDTIMTVLDIYNISRRWALRAKRKVETA